VLALVLYFIAIFKVESSLQYLVNSQTNGKYSFSVRKARLDLKDLSFDFAAPELLSLDSLSTASGYHIKAREFSIQLKSILPLFAGRPMTISSIFIDEPLIEVTKYRSEIRQKISLPDEMSKVYEALEKMLKVVQVSSLHIRHARFTVLDRTNPGSPPLIVKNLNLTIENVVKDETGRKEKFLFADRIVLEIFDEDIEFPDGLHGIRFKRFRLGTRSQTVNLDSCYIFGKSADSSMPEFRIFIDSIRIKKLDFNQLAKNSKIKFDSALCINPDIRVKLNLKSKNKKQNFLESLPAGRSSTEQKIRSMLGNLDIGYITVQNAAIHIETVKNNKTSVFHSQKSNFSLGGLLVSQDPSIPVKLGKLDLNIHDYSEYSPDSMYVMQFDNVSIRGYKIQLDNFRVLPSRSNHDVFRKEIRMQTFEMDDINWMELIYNHRLMAGKAFLVRPYVNLILPPAGTESRVEKQDNSPFQLLRQVGSKVKIRKFYVVDGTMRCEITDGPLISMDRFFFGIDVQRLLGLPDAYLARDAIDSLFFESGEYSHKGLRLTLSEGSYSRADSSILIRQIRGEQSDQRRSLLIKKLRIENPEFEADNTLSVKSLGWDEAVVELTMDEQTASAQKARKPASFNLVSDRILGGPTRIVFRKGALEAKAQFESLQTGKLSFTGGSKPEINGLNLSGHSLSFAKKDQFRIQTGEFRLIDSKPSLFRDVVLTLPLKGSMATLRIPEFEFSAGMGSLLSGNPEVDFVEIRRPEISFIDSVEPEVQAPGTQRSANKLPVFTLRRFSIDQPKIINLPASMKTGTLVDAGQTRFEIRGLRSDGSSIQADDFSLLTLTPGIRMAGISLIPTGKERLSVNGSRLNFRPSTATTGSQWSFELTKLSLADIRMNMLKDDTVKQAVDLRSLDIEHVQFSDSAASGWASVLSASPSFRISNGSLTLSNDKMRFGMSNLQLDRQRNRIMLDSLEFSPLAGKEDFMKQRTFQTPYVSLRTGNITLSRLDFGRLIADTVISAGKVTISDPNLYVYKDKRMPFRHGVQKPMLTNLVENLTPKISLDTIQLKSGLIRYQEINDRTGLPAQINLHKVKGVVTGFRTFNPLPSDSLRFNLYARLMDTADLRIKYQQSYTDSLSGFHLKLIVSAFDLTALNPMLRPLASAELRSGYLDTIRMSVTGRKYVAYGVMKMYYHDLNATYLSRGDSAGKTVMTRSVSFLANRIVHTRNQRGTGAVYAERDPEKGFVVYWMKIVIGGVFTNAGLRTNKQQERKYEKGIKIHNVPPIPDIPVDY
jgi:hypothetical protein